MATCAVIQKDWLDLFLKINRTGAATSEQHYRQGHQLNCTHS
jgi:hypothetical protein